MDGQVIRILKDKGFGFIRGSDNIEYFFHRSVVQGPVPFDNVVEGEIVAFETEQGPKGLRAKTVRSVG